MRKTPVGDCVIGLLQGLFFFCCLARLRRFQVASVRESLFEVKIFAKEKIIIRIMMRKTVEKDT